ncbi:FAD-binding oxidoreductase [Nocardioides sp. GY 10127]|uniref:NAD(P)/FAD-dependent oxidoreductase n=1 Tax=Nocardioides sp. GY 10127 TaxID=2569762 RepID=UPI0010A79AA7|nr:FAD-binding oxidoreductase [Nocardioides sp. GY 10127]TIC80042.1 FAD-dependent oxidoreductase [Nocardioides sp. GY 10127]
MFTRNKGNVGTYREEPGWDVADQWGGAGRCYWIEEALEAEGPVESQRLEEPMSADVAIVGGGFTGLWTAIELKDRDPNLEVVVLEANICGAGASGRNGGMALNYWSKIGGLAARIGKERAVWLADQSNDAIGELDTITRKHGLDIHFKRAGWVWTATSESQLDSWMPTIDSLKPYGREMYRVLDSEELFKYTQSEIHLAGVIDETAATVQPARLARALRTIALEKGVKVFEHSAVIKHDRDTGLLRTRLGSVRAPSVVLATNAWLSGMPELRRATVLVGSDVAVTSPLDPKGELAKSDFNSGVAVTNGRLTIRSGRTTADGRIMYGHSGGGLSYKNRFAQKFIDDKEHAAINLREFKRFHPRAGDVKVTHTWSGAVDRSYDGLPFLGELPGRSKTYYITGISGNGVGPCRMFGKMLASMVQQKQDEWTDCGLVQGVTIKYPPAPITYVGGSLVLSSVNKVEDAQEEGRKPNPVDKFWTRFTPQFSYKTKDLG